MERALQLAERALGWCSPNPAVGALIVQGSQVVGEGWTQPVGGPHAEIVALRQAGPEAAGGTMYVTLEPCAHLGRTPPCTDALIEARLGEVHAATTDPSPWVNGAGVRALEQAGIAVHTGTREREARQLNEAYFKWVATGRPFVTLKYAMTADGKIATRSGSSRWITGVEAREYVARLRSQVDAVLVGVGTVLADDPQLTARPGSVEDREPGDGGQVDAGDIHQPLRVVVDSTGRVPATARVVSGKLPGKTLLCVTERADAKRLAEVQAQGVEILVAPEQDGRVSLPWLMETLGQRGIISVLVEGGGTLAASLVAGELVDKVLAFVAPKLVGGAEAPTPLEGLGIDAMEAALELADAEWTPLGRDMLMTGYVAGPAPATSTEHEPR